MNKYEKLECIENAGWRHTKNRGFHRFTGPYPYEDVSELAAYEENDLNHLIEYMYNRFIHSGRDLPH